MYIIRVQDGENIDKMNERKIHNIIEENITVLEKDVLD